MDYSSLFPQNKSINEGIHASADLDSSNTHILGNMQSEEEEKVRGRHVHIDDQFGIGSGVRRSMSVGGSFHLSPRMRRRGVLGKRPSDSNIDVGDQGCEDVNNNDNDNRIDHARQSNTRSAPKMRNISHVTCRTPQVGTAQPVRWVRRSPRHANKTNAMSASENSMVDVGLFHTNEDQNAQLRNNMGLNKPDQPQEGTITPVKDSRHDMPPSGVDARSIGSSSSCALPTALSVANSSSLHKTKSEAEVSAAGGVVKRRGAWSLEEDATMLAAVCQHGKDWKQVSGCVLGRTPKQCRDRYKLQLDPSINHGPWSQEEDHMLLEMHKVVGNQWCKIAQCLEGRTEHSVKARHACIMRLKVREWSDEDDKLLMRCMQRGDSVASVVKNYMPHRSESNIKKRWDRLRMSALADRIRRDAASAASINSSSSSSSSSSSASSSSCTLAKSKPTMTSATSSSSLSILSATAPLPRPTVSDIGCKVQATTVAQDSSIQVTHDNNNNNNNVMDEGVDVTASVVASVRAAAAAAVAAAMDPRFNNNNKNDASPSSSPLPRPPPVLSNSQEEKEQQQQNRSLNIKCEFDNEPPMVILSPAEERVSNDLESLQLNEGGNPRQLRSFNSQSSMNSTTLSLQQARAKVNTFNASAAYGKKILDNVENNNSMSNNHIFSNVRAGRSYRADFRSTYNESSEQTEQTGVTTPTPQQSNNNDSNNNNNSKCFNDHSRSMENRVSMASSLLAPVASSSSEMAMPVSLPPPLLTPVILSAPPALCAPVIRPDPTLSRGARSFLSTTPQIKHNASRLSRIDSAEIIGKNNNNDSHNQGRKEAARVVDNSLKIKMPSGVDNSDAMANIPPGPVSPFPLSPMITSSLTAYMLDSDEMSHLKMQGHGHHVVSHETYMLDGYMEDCFPPDDVNSAPTSTSMSVPTISLRTTSPTHISKDQQGVDAATSMNNNINNSNNNNNNNGIINKHVNYRSNNNNRQLYFDQDAHNDVPSSFGLQLLLSPPHPPRASSAAPTLGGRMTELLTPADGNTSSTDLRDTVMMTAENAGGPNGCAVGNGSLNDSINGSMSGSGNGCVAATNTTSAASSTTRKRVRLKRHSTSMSVMMTVIGEPIGGDQHSSSHTANTANSSVQQHPQVQGQQQGSSARPALRMTTTATTYMMDAPFGR